MTGVVKLDAFSYGGGVQSTAALVLAARGEIDCKLFLFSNVGDDSEHPKTVAYVRDVAKPYADKHGIELVTLQRVMRDGTTRTLMEDLMRDSRSINIPVRMANGAPGNRNCTGTFKIDVVAKELKRRGFTKDNPATVGLGISTDEVQRARTDSGVPHQILSYPLIWLDYNRNTCMTLIASEGIPIPHRSACFFCPFHKPTEWKSLQRDEPDLFAKSVELERVLNVRRDMLGKDHVYLTGFGMPLDVAMGESLQDSLEGFENACEEGYCGV